MIYSLVGNTQINCSKIVLGTDYFGKTIAEEDSYRLMDYYCDKGGNMLDTAHVYSDYIPGERHMSEKVIGRWLRKSGLINTPRNKIYISTKGGFPELEDFHKSRLSYDNIKSDLESSLELLGVDKIDLYWLHRDNPAIPVNEIVGWMDEFVRDGLITCYGVSNWKCSRIDEANKYANQNGLVGIQASQIRWSLAQVTPEEDKDDTLVAMNSQEYAGYLANKIPVFAFSSQAKGFFSKIRVDIDGKIVLPEGKAGQRYANEGNIKRYRKLCELQKVYPHTSISQLSLLPIIKSEINGYAIVGCKNIQHLQDSMESADLDIQIDEKYLL